MSPNYCVQHKISTPHSWFLKLWKKAVNQKPRENRKKKSSCLLVYSAVKQTIGRKPWGCPFISNCLSHPHGRKRRGWQGPASHFPLFKFCIHTIKGIDSKDTFNFAYEVRKEWHCYATPLVWNICFPHPQDLLRNLYSFRQAGLTLPTRFPLAISIFLLKGVFIWWRHAPFFHKTHEPQGKLAPSLPPEVGVSDDHDWFKSPG